MKFWFLDLSTYVWCHDESEFVFLLFVTKVLSSIWGLQATGARLNPDLQEMNPVLVGSVELRVWDASTCTSELNVSALDEFFVAHIVLMSEHAADYVREDLEISVRMHTEASSR